MTLSSRRGLALLVVMGILAMLAVLGASFVVVSGLERRAARQRIHFSQARLLARSGLEDALARLEMGQDPSAPASAFRGEDWNADGVLNAGPESDGQVLRPALLDVEACPVAQAMRPSFSVLAAGNPRLVPVSGRERGYSGRLAPDGVEDLVYALKVEDESAKLNVNGGFLDALDRDADGIPDHRDADVRSAPADPKDTGRGWNFQLARVLDVLGGQPEVGLAALGQRAILARPEGGYDSLKALKTALGVDAPLEAWVTTSSWSDAAVLHPNAWAAQPAQLSFAEVKKTRGPLRLEEGGRPPVNLNAAARPVLAALMSDLQGVCWQNDGFPRLRTITPAMAAAIADRLLQARPFMTWPEVSVFCDGLVPGIVGGMNQNPGGGGNLDGADLLKANFDPNARLNKHLPDLTMFRWVDKSDLVAWSTEGALAPTGRFRLAATARRLSPEGRVLAEAPAEMLVELHVPLRHGTQAEFVGGRSRFQDYLSLGQAVWPTTGSASPGWKTWASDQGLGMMTHPAGPAGVAAGRPSELEGYLALATTEEAPSGAAGGFLTFLHHFDDGYDADQGAAPARIAGPFACDADLCPDPAGALWPDPASGSPEPATLYPDGLHIQHRRSPAFAAAPNLPATTWVSGLPAVRGALSLWVKTNKRRLGRPAYTEMLFSCVRGVNPATQALLVARDDTDNWGMTLENHVPATMDGPPNGEAQRSVRTVEALRFHFPGLRWQLVSVFWDTLGTRTGNQDVDFSLRGLLTETLGLPVVTRYADFGTASNQDLLSDPAVVMVLGGEARPVSTVRIEQAAGVIDELALVDFPDRATAKAFFDLWSARRYADGRYYKGEDAEFTSIPLDADGRGGRLKAVYWTAGLPTDPLMEVRPSQSAMPAAGTPRLQDARMSKASVEVFLLAPIGVRPLRPLVQGQRLDVPIQGVRYRARLKTGIADPLLTPALETPILDDVTFLRQPEGGARVLEAS